jgi:serine/threonine protein phosphatase 1
MILRRLFSAAPDTRAMPPPAPERQTYAVGDVHGCRESLQALLEEIERDPAGTEADLVFLGDYVDRGPDSAGVLADLMAMERDDPRVTCLAGNHDRMMLAFLDDPDKEVRWLWTGGEATLESFGVPVIQPAGREGSRAFLADQAAGLDAALGPELRAWLAARPLWWRSGNLVAVHALTDPARPMEEQDAETLTWARPGRDLAPRHDGAWVVHGHTVMPEPTIRAGHVAIDTGAFRGGPLTAAVFDPGAAPRFLQVPGYRP